MADENKKNKEEEGGENEEKQRAQEKEEEARKLKLILSEEQKKLNFPLHNYKFMNNERNRRSIFVGNVDFSTTNVELEKFFLPCGRIIRVTIVSHKKSRRSKGYAFIEFEKIESAQIALELDESLFKGRHIRVNIKRNKLLSLQYRGNRGALTGVRGKLNRNFNFPRQRYLRIP